MFPFTLAPVFRPHDAITRRHPRDAAGKHRERVDVDTACSTVDCEEPVLEYVAAECKRGAVDQVAYVLDWF